MLERELHIDLIVMATSGRSGLHRLLLGSVAGRVVHASSAPVVLLRPGECSAERLQTILVPIDGTPGGALALAMAAPLARACGARIVLLQASTYDAVAAQRSVELIAARLLRVGLAAEARGVLGLPEKAIVDCADEVDADLIVMSTRARHGPLRSILGSVADEVVRTCRRPVMLVQRGAARKRAVHSSVTRPATLVS
jgi:nucleotide-binding universal stress UspA family protein